MQKVGCKSLSDFIVFLEMDEQLEEKLQKFAVEFERLIFCICFVFSSDFDFEFFYF
jgi:hypothetical protein